ncbi:unnamed protein product, partial [Litomosoides sigmodontis]
VEKNAFVMKCSMTDDEASWAVDIIGCKTQSGATVPMNSSMIEGNFEWICSKNSDGQVAMQRNVHENATCGEHPRGEQWRETSFLYECAKGGRQELVACIADGEVEISVGESKEIGGFIVNCEKFENGTVAMYGIRKGAESGSAIVTECIDSNDERHAVDSWWIADDHFNMTCSSDGSISVMNCIAKDGTEVPVNKEMIIDDTKYKYA